MKNAVVPATSTQRRRTASASNGGRRVRSPVGTLVGNALTLLFSTLCVVSSETPGRNRPPAGNLVSLAAGAVSGGFKVDCVRRISSAVTAGPRGRLVDRPRCCGGCDRRTVAAQRPGWRGQRRTLGPAAGPGAAGGGAGARVGGVP